jgi:aryl-alcohol dehydrogenase-like predicted oxidoreductase
LSAAESIVKYHFNIIVLAAGYRWRCACRTLARMTTIDSLARYRLLGRTGLRVSPLCLGTMTFGTEWGWGAPRETCEALLDRFFDAGGNFVDTADGYTGGTSEQIAGDWIAKRGERDRVVLATKYTFSGCPGDPNAGGNARKNLHRALEGSLRRLKTDYVDLYWVHCWDGLTPVEEVVRSLDDVVRAGKVRYVGLSDVPAWYFARAQTLAELRGWERVAALQLEYSLVERNIEREHIPAAQELGAGLVPWSPLASGLLSGKYTREGVSAQGEGRLAALQKSQNPAFLKLFTERNWRILDELCAVAEELARPVAQVALNWVARRPGVTSTIIGATKLEQLESNLLALSFEIPETLRARLDLASEPDVVHPYLFFRPEMQGMVSGGTNVSRG